MSVSTWAPSQLGRVTHAVRVSGCAASCSALPWSDVIKDKAGVVKFVLGEVWDGYTWGSVRPEARTGQRPGNTRPEADP